MSAVLFGWTALASARQPLIFIGSNTTTTATYSSPTFKQYIEDGKTIVVSPHKVFGPQTNDLVLQLLKRGISKIILGGMLANMCVESHLRELLEQGFEVAIVNDATAGPRHPVWGDGYEAAMINYRFLAHAVLSTDETVDGMR